MAFRAGAIAAMLALALLAGCGERPSERPDRFARKYLPFERGWLRESKIPAKPQSSPEMVIWEVSRFDPRVPPTPEQQAAADDLVERCHQAAVKHGWYDHAKGLADGFETNFKDRLHHRKDEYVLDGIQLDPERPEYLMYYPTEDGGQALTGFMFLADGPEAWGEQIGGPLTVWHYHVWTRKRCWVQDLLSAGPADAAGRCGVGVARHRSPEMVHVWLIDHPRGPFSSGMTLPRDVLERGLAKRMRERGL